jgi:hypothetical protein
MHQTIPKAVILQVARKVTIILPRINPLNTRAHLALYSMATTISHSEAPSEVFVGTVFHLEEAAFVVVAIFRIYTGMRIIKAEQAAVKHLVA